MSHFAVLAILTPTMIEEAGGKEEALQQLMLPYKELGCGSPDPDGFVEEYCEWKDIEAEYKAEYEGEREFDASYLYYSPCDRMIAALPIEDEQRKQLKQLLEAVSEAEKTRGRHDPLRVDTSTGTDVVQARKDVSSFLKANKIEIAFAPKDIYDSFEEFVQDWHGSERQEGTPTAYGYYRNPNTQWDWYQVGGRWAGYLARYVDGNHQKEFDRGPFGLGVDTEEFFTRKDINVTDMRATAQEEAHKFWNLFNRARPFLTDELYLKEERRKEAFDMRDEDETLGSYLMWMDRERFYQLGWVERVLPEIRLLQAREKLQELAEVKQVAGGGTEITYPETFEHPWGTFQTADLVRAVNGTKFLHNRARMNEIIHSELGADAFKQFEKDVREAPDTREYLKSLDIDWDKYLDDPLDDYLFIEREDRLVKEPSLDDVMAHKYLWEWGTYAVVDSNGWHSKGEMGWFGCSSETPEESAEFDKSYISTFIEGGNEDDIVALVDCHI